MKKILGIILCGIVLCGCSGSKNETIVCKRSMGEGSSLLTELTLKTTYKGDELISEEQVYLYSGDAATNLKSTLETTAKETYGDFLGEQIKVTYEDIDDGFKMVVTIDLASLSEDDLLTLGFESDQEYYEKDNYISSLKTTGFECE